MTNQTTNRVFSAIQPSGEMHIGNYLGALKHFVEMQDKYECLFFIADYHSITENYDPKEKPKQIMDVALDYLAAGLDPKKCIIARQSDIPEHMELAWIFDTLTPMGLLERMTQYKDKSQRQAANINVGLFNYPVLQAADILLYKAGLVPVGQDQVQHLELSREIARLFNNKFGDTFAEPQALLTKTPKIMSLLDPTKKMSKSAGSKSYIGINDSPETIKEKIKKAVTASNIKELYESGLLKYEINKEGKKQMLFYDIEDIEEGLEKIHNSGRKFKGITYHDEKKVSEEKLKAGNGIINLYKLMHIFCSDDHKKYFSEKFNNGDLKFSELKEVLAQDIADYFAPFRARRQEMEAKPEYVREVLADGAERASKIARETMKEVKEKIGLVI